MTGLEPPCFALHSNFHHSISYLDLTLIYAHSRLDIIAPEPNASVALDTYVFDYEKSSPFSSIAFFTFSKIVVFHLSNLLI